MLPRTNRNIQKYPRLYRVSILTTYSSSKPCSSSGSPVTGSQSFTRNLSVHKKVPDTGKRERRGIEIKRWGIKRGIERGMERGGRRIERGMERGRGLREEEERD